MSDFPELARAMKSLPGKEYFGIREVARFVNVSQGTLRYWEEMFRSIRPKRSSGGQRLYRRSDVREILRVKYLLKEERLTIEGARRRLDANKAA